jgi:hypothetical protein
LAVTEQSVTYTSLALASTSVSGPTFAGAAALMFAYEFRLYEGRHFPSPKHTYYRFLSGDEWRVLKLDVKMRC